MTQNRWIWYYGIDGSLPSMSYYMALNQEPGFFKSKIVFIGGKLRTPFTREETDEYHTPFTHLGGPFMSGQEVQATTFLNLLRKEWLTEMPRGLQVLLLLFCGALFGWGLSLLHPLAGAGIAALSALAVGLGACLLFGTSTSGLPGC